MTSNDLRRTHASWLKNKGIDSAAVAALLGNTTVMVDRVYGRISLETLRAAVSHLPVPDRCATGEQDTAAFNATSETMDDLATALIAQESRDLRVPRDGVEPPTRGFSVPEDLSVFDKKRGLRVIDGKRRRLG